MKHHFRAFHASFYHPSTLPMRTMALPNWLSQFAKWLKRETRRRRRELSDENAGFIHSHFISSRQHACVPQSKGMISTGGKTARKGSRKMSKKRMKGKENSRGETRHTHLFIRVESLKSSDRCKNDSSSSTFLLVAAKKRGKTERHFPSTHTHTNTARTAVPFLGCVTPPMRRDSQCVCTYKFRSATFASANII